MYILIPKDVLHTKKQVFMGLGWKQILLCITGAIPAFTLFFNINGRVDSFLAMLAFTAIFAPFAFLAFYHRNGQYADILAKRFILQKIRRRSIRVYKVKNPPKTPNFNQKGGINNANSPKSARLPDGQAKAAKTPNQAKISARLPDGQAK
ncbi:MAG: PrgI family protein [Turicibacter sp.]|nr:PrgI family protein [Turicibacter sp.]